ncbi:hypothetical protein RPO_05255 [Rickettsia rickettsii str. Arizona]|uniref:Uncharacterized protein n=2 Tax=spotted fever group TaxID=114277 RepID=A0A0H3AYW5_RICRS|nr:hypothetical protein A1G_05195 [Rickettsia rickettsii str. 'Sheila Smith']AFB25229.1 hypothetical protein RPO_05255 [Rickettsia rickettsii str. Arizona]AFB26569.1 hypothetical protein RSA_05230 [Rickettsia philipii str. 364D]AFB29230.1 hypothetical protein RPK_05165 [Rickettsia rickettsii str. Hlp\
MWLLSIFGNYDPEDYYLKPVKPIELFHWSLLFALILEQLFITVQNKIIL